MIASAVKTLQKRIIALLVVSFSLSMAVLSPTALAAVDATQSLNAPASATQGQTFTVKVNANTGTTDGVTVVLSKVTFDAAKVQFVSVDFTGAEAMTSTGSEEAAGAGYFQFSRFTTTPMSASHAFLIGTLTFKALGSSGTSAFSIVKADSHMQAGASDVLGSVSGGSTTLQAPAPAPTSPAPAANNPTPTPTGQSSSPATPTKTSTPSTPAATTSNPSTPASTPTAPDTTPSTSQLTNAQGAPITASTTPKKKSNSFMYMGAVGVLVVAISAALVVFRKKLPDFMHRRATYSPTGSSAQTSPAVQPTPSLSSLPPANNQAPGEVIAPVDGQAPKPPTAQ